MSKKSWLNAFVLNLNCSSKLEYLNIETSMKRSFNKLKEFWIFITNAKDFVNLFLTFLFNMKIKKNHYFKTITNEFSIEICKIKKNLNIFMRLKFRSIHDNINSQKTHLNLMFVDQEFQKFNFFLRKTNISRN